MADNKDFNINPELLDRLQKAIDSFNSNIEYFNEIQAVNKDDFCLDRIKDDHGHIYAVQGKSVEE